MLAKVAPADADELLETKLQREAEAAHHNRSLRFWRQGGSVRFAGSLPKLAGEQFITLLDAHSEALRRTAVEARDPLYVNATPNNAAPMPSLTCWARRRPPNPNPVWARRR